MNDQVNASAIPRCDKRNHPGGTGQLSARDPDVPLVWIMLSVGNYIGNLTSGCNASARP